MARGDAGREKIVQGQPHPDFPEGASGIPKNGQIKGPLMTEMGCLLQPVPLLLTGLPNQPDVHVFKIAYAPVENFGGGSAGLRAEILFVDQEAGDPVKRQIPKNPRPHDAPTDNQDGIMIFDVRQRWHGNSIMPKGIPKRQACPFSELIALSPSSIKSGMKLAAQGVASKYIGRIFSWIFKVLLGNEDLSIHPIPKVFQEFAPVNLANACGEFLLCRIL